MVKKKGWSELVMGQVSLEHQKWTVDTTPIYVIVTYIVKSNHYNTETQSDTTIKLADCGKTYYFKEIECMLLDFLGLDPNFNKRITVSITSINTLN